MAACDLSLGSVATLVKVQGNYWEETLYKMKSYPVVRIVKIFQFFFISWMCSLKTLFCFIIWEWFPAYITRFLCRFNVFPEVILFLKCNLAYNARIWLMFFSFYDSLKFWYKSEIYIFYLLLFYLLILFYMFSLS